MTDQQKNQFAMSMSMLSECADVLLENMPQQEDCSLLQAAHARFAEFQALVHLSAGQPYPFNKKLGPLIRAIDDFVKDVDKQINVPIDENELPEDSLMEALAAREEAAQWLGQARIAGCALLVHLSQAMREQPKLSLVSTSTSG